MKFDTSLFFSKKSKYPELLHWSQELFGEVLPIDLIDLKHYQDLIVYDFIKKNIPIGSKILDVGGGDSRILRALHKTYDCWNLDKFEGLGNGPLSTVDMPFNIVRDYLGNFNSALENESFDLVFSISALEHVGDDPEWHKKICDDLDRLLKPGGISFHCFDCVGSFQGNPPWMCQLLPYMIERYENPWKWRELSEIAKEADLFSMHERSYNLRWKNITKKEFINFGFPFSCQALWQKKAISSPVLTELKLEILKPTQAPKITLVTPSYQQGDYIEETLDSVLSQNYPNLEYIVLDGGSTDQTRTILQKYEKHLSYWRSHADQGQYAAIAEGLNRGTGTIQGWINSDDLLMDYTLALVSEKFQSESQVNWLSGIPCRMKPNKEIETTQFHPIYTRERLIDLLFWDPYIQQEGSFWRTELWQQSGAGFSPELKLAGDLELWLKFFRLTNLTTLDCVLGIFRQHDNQKSSLHYLKYFQEATDLILNERDINRIFLHSNTPSFLKSGLVDNPCKDFQKHLYHPESNSYIQFHKDLVQQNFDLATQKLYHTAFDKAQAYRNKHHPTAIIENMSTPTSLEFHSMNFLLSTSIAPVGLEKQQIAIDSWLKLGFKVASFNNAQEIQELKDLFPRVQFIEVQRDGRARTQKPLVYVDDILTWYQNSTYEFGGFINSDIILDTEAPSLWNLLQKELPGSLVFTRRIEVENPASRTGEFYRTGFDLWMWDRNILSCYPKPTEYFVGFPHWDYFMCLMPICHGIPIKQIQIPIAYHAIHKQFYDVVRDGIPYGLKTFEYIAPYYQQIPNKDHLLIPQLEYFLEHQPGNMDTPENTKYYYTFLHVLDKFFLETIDRNSIWLKEYDKQTQNPATCIDVLNQPLISVVIPTHNRIDILQKCLEHLAKQNIGCENFEVIVVDDGSSDSTALVLKQMQWPYAFSAYTQKNSGPGPARNFGLKIAKAPIVLILNDDALLEPNALQIHLEEHSLSPDPSSCVLGRFRMHNDYLSDHSAVGYVIENTDLIFEYPFMIHKYRYGSGMFYTCNISVKKDFFLSNQLFFDLGFSIKGDGPWAGAEDIELGIRLENLGGGVIYREDCIAWHAHKLTAKEIARMYVTRGKGGVLVFYRHNKPHFFDTIDHRQVKKMNLFFSHCTPFLNRILDIVDEIQTLPLANLEFLPQPLMGSFLQLDPKFYYLWNEPLEVVTAVTERVLSVAESLLTRHKNNPMAGSEIMGELFLVLYFIKWIYDTQGVIQSPYILAHICKLHNRPIDCEPETPVHLDPVLITSTAGKPNFTTIKSTPNTPILETSMIAQPPIPFYHHQIWKNIQDPYSAYVCRRWMEGNHLSFRHGFNFIQMLLEKLDFKNINDPKIPQACYIAQQILAERPFDDIMIGLLLQFAKLEGKGNDHYWQQLHQEVKQFDGEALHQAWLTFEDELKEEASQKFALELQKNPRNLGAMWGWIKSTSDFSSAPQKLQAFQSSPHLELILCELYLQLVLSGDTGSLQDLVELLNTGVAPKRYWNAVGQIFQERNQIKEAEICWSKSLECDPLQVYTALRLRDLKNNWHNLIQTNLSSVKIHILLYTFNKKDLIKSTLEGLSRTHLGNSLITVLNNNSTDGTKEFLDREAQALFPNNQVNIIHLPTNVGAPAARNWLKNLEINRSMDFICYLDDDVVLGADWLERLVGTIQAFPSASAVGCRIINGDQPQTLQYGGTFIEYASDEKLSVSYKFTNDLDLGQISYIRPVMNVMGCCHLFRAKDLVESAEFDIRFSPSQVDDIDHDLMMTLKGHQILYNGHIAVTHLQKTGKQTKVSRLALGNVKGNVIKWVHKYEAKELQDLKSLLERNDLEFVRTAYKQLQLQDPLPLGGF